MLQIGNNNVVNDYYTNATHTLHTCRRQYNQEQVKKRFVVHMPTNVINYNGIDSFFE